MSIHPDVLAAKSRLLAERAISKERVKASRPKKKIAATLEGQLADVLREHFAYALPANPARRKRNGNRLPLSAWMLGANTHCSSKIMAVLGGQARYPYNTQKASSYVLADRIAARHGITPAQKFFLYGYVNRRYNGNMYDHEQELRLAQRMDRDLFRMSLDALEVACAKYHSDFFSMPLRAILDPQVTNLLLLIQLNAVIKHKKLIN